MSGRLANSPCSFFWLVLALAAAPAVAQHAEAGHSWSYEGEHGPAHWGEVSPEYSVCRTGKHQSPIDIRGATAAGLPPIVFSYAPSPLGSSTTVRACRSTTRPAVSSRSAAGDTISSSFISTTRLRSV